MTKISLADFKPSPTSGQWYTVLCEEGTVRMVVLIHEKHPTIARTTSGAGSGVANFFDPILVTKEEAKTHLAQEIIYVEAEIKKLPNGTGKNMLNIILRSMKSFYKYYFEN